MSFCINSMNEFAHAWCSCKKKNSWKCFRNMLYDAWVYFAFCIWPWPVFFFPLCPELIMANFYGLMLFFMHFGLVRLRKKICRQCYHDYNFAFIGFFSGKGSKFVIESQFYTHCLSYLSGRHDDRQSGNARQFFRRSAKSWLPQTRMLRLWRKHSNHLLAN